MQLSKATLSEVQFAGVDIPDASLFNLPEKVLQFGSGVLLRGLIDYFIDKANKEGNFNGRVVVIHSIEKERPLAHEQQDYMYTHCLRGLQNGNVMESYVINASISRVLLAFSEWEKVMAYADSNDIEVIISNTTEVGISYLPGDNIGGAPPASFPGKLLALLYRRYQTFNGDPDKGWTIVPAELIIDNGTKLKQILKDLAVVNNLEDEFVHWLVSCNRFCNTLVDRIVPGRLEPDAQVATEGLLGYTDAMMIMSEVYSLWAIETNDPEVHRVLSFSKSNPGVIVTHDIEKYRELKLRLLNGTHTFVCGLAVLAGFDTVKDAMEHPVFSGYVQQLMLDEIVPCITGSQITEEEAVAFVNNVIERFGNPFIDHKWLSITLNYTYKMKGRNVFLLNEYVKRTGRVPELMAMSFAAYLLFNRCTPTADGKFEGVTESGHAYLLQDAEAALFSEWWSAGDALAVTEKCIDSDALWEGALSDYLPFKEAVAYYLNHFLQSGVMHVLNHFHEVVNYRNVHETQGIEST